MSEVEVQAYAKGFKQGWDNAETRAEEIIKSHFVNTYPINCKAIIDEIRNQNEVNNG